MTPHRLAALVAALLPAALLPPAALASDQVPGPPQTSPVALVGGTVLPVSGPVIEDGTVVFEGGRIVAVGADVAVPEGAEVIDCAGSFVYPALFDAETDLGLVEIGAVRATRDQREAGDLNPSARAAVAVNPDSELIPTTRANGVLLAHVLPAGGLVSGTAAVMKLDGWTYEDMTLAEGGVVVDWPDMEPPRPREDEDDEEQDDPREGRLRQLEDFFAAARDYVDDEAPAYDARYEAMRPVMAGDAPLLVRADEARQIEAGVAFALRHGARPIVVGGRDALACADLLVGHDVPVILDGVHRLPAHRDSDPAEPFELPAKLAEAGVRFCVSGNRGASFVRNLPYHAATADAHGLGAGDALASITLWPAQILGVGDEVGSLEAGKAATLFVADGDILEVPTQVTHAWIDGRRVDLTSRHTMLDEKYRKRLDGTE